MLIMQLSVESICLVCMKSWVQSPVLYKLDRCVVIYTHNLSTQEMKAEGSEVQGHPLAT